MAASSNTEASGRFHTDWLNMMYPRLKLAKNLLRENGLIFVSIDDREIVNLRFALDDIFGQDCFIAQLIWKNKYNAGALTKGFSNVHEYILCYSKGEISNLTAPLGEEEIAGYKGRDSKFATRGGYVTQPLATTSKDSRPNLRYPITIGGREIWPEKQWIWSQDRINEALQNNEVILNESSGKPSVRVKQYLKGEDGSMREMKPLSILIGPYNQEGTKETVALFEKENVFSFPKPVDLVKHLIALTVDDKKEKDGIVLDFFGGSGTTGHAVMAQNAIDGGTRRYILVQLPEPLDFADSGQKAAHDFCESLGKPRTIAELTKERLRRVATKIRAANASITRATGQLSLEDSEQPARTPPLSQREREQNPLPDLGFRVFKLDHSNIRAWNPKPDDLLKAVNDYQDNLLPGRTEADILYELLLKLGLDLCVPIATRQLAGLDVHAVGGGVLLACLAPAIAATEVDALASGIIAWRKELLEAAGDSNPDKKQRETTCVFRDSAFADDIAKANLSAILAQQGIQNVRSL